MKTAPIVLLAAALATAPENSWCQAGNYPNGSTVDNFITLGTDGTWYTLHEITAAGKVVVLDFFFYDCEPCQAYAPYFSELYETYGCNSGGLFCLSVNAGIDSDELAEQFAIDFGGDFAHPPTIGMFNGGLLTDDFGVVAFPTVCVIDVDNTMHNNQLWPTSLEDLVAALPENGTAVPMACTVGIEEASGTVQALIAPSTTAGTTNLLLDLPYTSRVRTEVIDLLGRPLRVIEHGTVRAGRTSHSMDLGQLGEGGYVLRVVVNEDAVASHRLILAR